MSIVTGSIVAFGAAVDVLVSVSKAREEKLRKMGHSVPPAVCLRLVLDTGSYATGLASDVFSKLEIGPVAQSSVHTTLTAHDCPQLADVFDVNITLVSGMDKVVLPNVLVLSSPSCTLRTTTNGILGRDILNNCMFEYFGREKSFRLAF